MIAAARPDHHTPVPTPWPTKFALIATLAMTAWVVSRILVGRTHPPPTGMAAAVLVLLTGLFLLRVVGQLVVVTRPTSWLPAADQWALTPYRVLLPTQLAILGLLGWIDLDFALGRGFWTEPRPALGTGVLWFSGCYAGAMAIRYVVRMIRRPDERWFGGTIPIVFHEVLAGYLAIFGNFHAAR
jgi:hypothetical protein